MFGINWLRTTRLTLAWTLAVLLTLGLGSCGKKAIATLGTQSGPSVHNNAASAIAEVSPPEAIQELRLALDNSQPQVTVVSPKPNQVVQDNTVSVKMQVDDLELFQDPQLGMGPHLHVILDNQPYEAVYDVSKPFVFKDVAPGTHTLRVFASRPWHESFKNEGAYAQTTFHVFTKTQGNNPSSTLPLLTYSRPKGSYGAEPVMLDFYLSNAPLHLVAQERSDDNILDWQIRCTINGASFFVNRWQPIYLQGLKPGKNWVHLELLDEKEKLISNAFNDTARLITFTPGGDDTLSKLVRGELKAADARAIVDPSYIAKTQAPSVPLVPSAPKVSAPLELPTPPTPAVPLETASPEDTGELSSPKIGQEQAAQLMTPTSVNPKPTGLKQPKQSGFLNRFHRQPATETQPEPATLPKIIETPAPQPATVTENRMSQS